MFSWIKKFFKRPPTQFQDITEFVDRFNVNDNIGKAIQENIIKLGKLKEKIKNI